jgi:hypothetical protein
MFFCVFSLVFFLLAVSTNDHLSLVLSAKSTIVTAVTIVITVTSVTKVTIVKWIYL